MAQTIRGMVHTGGGGFRRHRSLRVTEESPSPPPIETDIESYKESPPPPLPPPTPNAWTMRVTRELQKSYHHHHEMHGH